jgi:GH25 family lysozyme M1 (1,4-beta-N-acetylmuramidase)
MNRHRSARLALLVLPLAAAACAGSPGTENLGATNEDVTEKCGASPGGSVQGRDTSIYQGDFDWKATHVDFGYARISDGLGDIDSEFGNSWTHMKAAHIRRGAYQFFEPSESASEQAKLMVEKVGKLGAGDLPAMIDVEVTDGRSPSEMASAIRTWLEAVEAGTGLRPIIYVGSYFWEDNVRDTNFGKYPIWIAAYGTACPSLPPGWSNWTFWQYSDGGGALDHDVFNGSLADLDKLEGGAPAVKPPASTAPLYTTTVAVNDDGRLEAFSRGGGDALYHRWQKTADGAWDGWADLSGVLSSDVSIGVNEDGRLEAFGVGGGRAVYHRSQKTAGGAWSDWESLGGELTSKVAVIRNSDKRLEIFARGTNDELYRKTQKASGWTAWESLGGKITSDPSVAMNKDGRLEVFARGTGDVPYHKWEETAGGAWSDWYSLGGKLSSDPIAVRDAEGRLEVFGVGMNHAVYRSAQKSVGGTWTDWESLGGDVTSNVAVASNKDGRLEIFARGTNDALFHAWEKSAGGSWTGWDSLGGKITSNPSVAVNKDGRLEAFGRGTNDALYTMSQKTAGGAWTAWASLGGTIK